MDKENNLQNQINELKNEINNLKSSSTIPLDIQEALIGRGFLKYDGDLNYVGGVSGQLFPNIFIKYSNKRFLLPVGYPVYAFRADPATDTCYSPAHMLNDGNTVSLYTTDTLPGGIDDPMETYAVLNPTNNSFQLTTDGVNPVNITDAGVGTQYAQPY
jgi:hypothetical protein